MKEYVNLYIEYKNQEYINWGKLNDIMENSFYESISLKEKLEKKDIKEWVLRENNFFKYSDNELKYTIESILEKEDEIIIEYKSQRNQLMMIVLIYIYLVQSHP